MQMKSVDGWNVTLRIPGAMALAIGGNAILGIPKVRPTLVGHGSDRYWKAPFVISGDKCPFQVPVAHFDQNITIIKYHF